MGNIVLGDYMHSIDVSKFQVRTDLIVDSKIDEKYPREHFEDGKIIVDRVFIDDDATRAKYITISFDDVSDKDNYKLVEDRFIKELKLLLNDYKIEKEETVLVVGLGNSNSTPDSLGPKVVENILVTRYLFSLGEVEDGYQKVAAFKPEVTGVTGIETKELIESLVKTIDAKMVLVIDALASSAISRVNKTIQITDSGIHPGSGVGNDRKEVSAKTLGIPVVAIGVPTIVDAVTIVSDTFQYMLKQFSFKINNSNKASLKLVDEMHQDYRGEEKELSSFDKERILGMIGELSEDEFKQLIYEVLSPIQSNLMVTPKEVDFMIDKLGLLIGNGINKSLHASFNPTN